MTDWPRGGYPAGDTPASELKPPPASMISKQRHPAAEATYTAAEVKVLTEAALRLGRKEALDEIAAALVKAGEERSKDRHHKDQELRDHGSTRYAAYLDAATIARNLPPLPPQDASDATSGVPRHSEVSEAPKAPQEPCEDPECPVPLMHSHPAKGDG